MIGNRREAHGRPFIALGCLLLAWALARAVLWESPFKTTLVPEKTPVLLADTQTGKQASHSRPMEEEKTPPADYRLPLPAISGGLDLRTPWWTSRDIARFIEPLQTATPTTCADVGPAEAMAGVRFAPANLHLTKGEEPEGRDIAAWPSDYAIPAVSSSPLSISAWAFWREGSGVAANSAIPPASYGASQVGAVLRYRLDPESEHRPDGFLRATHALARQEETDLAAGASARPIPRLPVRAHFEARLSLREGRTEIRPAVYLVTELPERKLPLGLAARVYGQAGYVGGDFATGFVDGVAVVDREVDTFGIGGVRLAGRVGLGAWGGAQKGTERLDMGPSATLDIRGTSIPLRVSTDYRFRVAGRAEPDSGLAVTVSTGF